MKPTPGLSTKRNTYSPLKEREKITSETAKRLVTNAYTNIHKTWPKGEHWSMTACVQKTADILGLSSSTVRSVIREYKNKNDLSSLLKEKHDPKIIIDTCMAPYNSMTIQVKKEPLPGESGEGSTTVPSDNDSRSSMASHTSKKSPAANSPMACRERLAAKQPGSDGTAGASSLDAQYSSVHEPSDVRIKRERDRGCDRDRDMSKPQYSFKQLIAQALAAAPDKKLTLNQIYSYVADRHPYYDCANRNWQNSIRHTLSLNKCFIKVPRNQEEPGKRGCWRIAAPSAGRALALAFRPRRARHAPLRSRGNHGNSVSASTGEE